jgi:hypothetical protein
MTTATMTRAKPSPTNPYNKQEPMWYRIGRRRPVTDGFKNLHRAACIHQQSVFFSDDLSDQVIAKKICSTCPTFNACALWALLSPNCDTEFGIIAGMDPDHRRRIREGRENFWDWRPKFNYAEKAAMAAKHKRDRDGVRKRDRRRTEIPLCPGCGSNHDVSRDGRDKVHNRQRYTCTTCGSSFLGEEL